MITHIMNSIFLILILVTILLLPSYTIFGFPAGITDPFRIQKPQLWLTISAQTRKIEVSWINARLALGDKIFITNAEPKEFRKVRIYDNPDFSTGSASEIQINTNDTNSSRQNDSSIILNDNNYDNNDDDGSGNNNNNNNNDNDNYGIIPIAAVSASTINTNINQYHNYNINTYYNNNNDKNINKNNYENNNWECNNGNVDILEVINPLEPSQWIQTNLRFDYTTSKNITNLTKCYGHWASYVDIEGNIVSIGCIRAYPQWMNDMRTAIGQFRIRDLFIPGSHDSGSYRDNFKPSKLETIVTKYALTQDDDIKSQLMHGIRYLDIRVGYYKKTEEQFFINHGITKQIPLRDALNQIRDFVLETNEIIIVDVQEFPVGFGKDLMIHRKLVQYIYSFFKDLLIDPQLSWQVRLSDIWRRKQNIFLSYDHSGVVAEFPYILFPACEQRWGNVQKWSDLEKYLRKVNTIDMWRLSSRPVSDMAELTPKAWDIITDKYGGLRKMADQVNFKVSRLYREDLGSATNIVSVDFYRGTTIIDLAIYFNLKKVIS